MSEQFSLLYILRSIQGLCSIVGRVGNSPVMLQAWAAAAGAVQIQHGTMPVSEKFLATCHYCRKERDDVGVRRCILLRFYTRFFL
jgi:hypothetical protein